MKKVLITFAFVFCFTCVATAGKGFNVPSAKEAAKGMLSPAGPTKFINEGTKELNKRMIKGTKIVTQKTLEGTKIVNQETLKGTKIVNKGTKEVNQLTINGTGDPAGKGKGITKKASNQVKTDSKESTRRMSRVRRQFKDLKIKQR